MMMTPDFEAFHVDHDTNHIKHAPQNFGTTDQVWSIQYCRESPKAKSPEEMGYNVGYLSKYWFFGWRSARWWGYDTSSRPTSWETYNTVINFPNDRSFYRQYWYFPSNHFAAEWTGFIQINLPGNYLFSTTSDDGSRLWINDEKVVENWYLHGRRRREGTKNLQTGWHSVKVAFFENWGAANCVVKYKGPDTSDGETLLPAYH